MEDKKSLAGAWVEAARPRTLPASVSPVLLGCALAYYDGMFDITPAVLCLLVALFAQIASNFANDYFDFKKGADREGRRANCSTSCRSRIPHSPSPRGTGCAS